MTTPTTTPGLVLVTGGSGYIAGYCIAQLLSDGWREVDLAKPLGASIQQKAEEWQEAA
jgi:nucleoside-diphosphate-sugar epimerase